MHRFSMTVWFSTPTDTWPTLPEIRFGEKEVRRLCQRFNLDPREAVEGMRDFVTDKPAQIPDGLKKLTLV